MLAVFTIPYNNNLNSYCILFFCLIAFLSNGFKEKARLLRNNKVWILPVLYFLWIAFSITWDLGQNKSTKFLEGSTSFIVLPLIIGSIRPLSKPYLRKVFLLFVLANIIAAIYCIVMAYKVYKETNYINFFFYHYLSMHISMNAIYFSLYSVFCVIILLYYTFYRPASIGIKTLFLISAFFLVIFSVMLSSKMLLFILFISLVSLVLNSFFYFKKVKPGLIIILVFLTSLPVLLMQFPYVKARINDTKLLAYKSSADDYNGIAVRSLLWKSSWELIQRKPILGYGHVGAQDSLRLKYKIASFDVGVKENYNSHNQYLYTWLNYGIIGILLILGYMYHILKYSLLNRSVLGVLFISMFVIANITECMLQVQKGIVFFMLFSSIFLFHYFNKTTEVVV